MVILGESGSGKSLAYLLPIVNSLQHHKDNLQMSLGGELKFDYSSASELEENVDKINRGYFRFNQQSESQMFQNANELYYQEKKRQLSEATSAEDQIQQQMDSMKGALVISY